MRFGKKKPVKDNFLPDPMITVLSTTQEEAMPDTKNTMVKKTVKNINTFALSIF